VSGDARAPGAERVQVSLRACLLRKALADCRLRAAAATALGVTPTDVLALQHLASTGVLTRAALSARLQLTSSGISTLVQRLERHGLVTSEPHPEDRRSALLRLSATGAQSAARAYGSLVADVDAIIDALRPGERALVETFLSRVAAVTEARADELARSVRSDRTRVTAVPHAGLWA
jgi:DNA-binding MarR family transcriptional regulator